jgi:hypothetical protein
MRLLFLITIATALIFAITRFKETPKNVMSNGTKVVAGIVIGLIVYVITLSLGL